MSSAAHCRSNNAGRDNLPAAPSGKASEIFRSVVSAHQLADFRDPLPFPGFWQDSRYCTALPDEKLPELSEAEIQAMLSILCGGKTRLEELANISLVDSFAARLTNRQRSLLDRETPERVKLGTGRAVQVHYEPAKPPWIESRLQDFFGMLTTPSICRSRVPLTIHLLAPNGRALQVTSDLAGFWQRHYPSIRKELQRRYPKHAWPSFSSDNSRYASAFESPRPIQ
jgi:ATP-dependent helicase HrpB